MFELDSGATDIHSEALQSHKMLIDTLFYRAANMKLTGLHMLTLQISN